MSASKPRALSNKVQACLYILMKNQLFSEGTQTMPANEKQRPEENPKLKTYK